MQDCCLRLVENSLRRGLTAALQAGALPLPNDKHGTRRPISPSRKEFFLHLNWGGAWAKRGGLGHLQSKCSPSANLKNTPRLFWTPRATKGIRESLPPASRLSPRRPLVAGGGRQWFVAISSRCATLQLLTTLAAQESSFVGIVSETCGAPFPFPQIWGNGTRTPLTSAASAPHCLRLWARGPGRQRAPCPAKRYAALLAGRDCHEVTAATCHGKWRRWRW